MPEYSKKFVANFKDLLDDPGSNSWSPAKFRRLLDKAGSPTELKAFLAKKRKGVDGNHVVLAGSGQYFREAETIVIERLCRERSDMSYSGVKEDLRFFLTAGLCFNEGNSNPLLEKYSRNFKRLRVLDQISIQLKLITWIRRMNWPSVLQEQVVAIHHLAKETRLHARHLKKLIHNLEIGCSYDENFPKQVKCLIQALKLAQQLERGTYS